MVETVKPAIQSRFIKRIFDQARYLEGDLSEYLFDFGLQKGMVALELGSCIGLHAKKIAEKIYPGVVISLEKDHDYALFQKEYIHHCRGDVLLIEGDAHCLPLGDALCDFAYSRFLFQHLYDPRKVLLEIRRVLKNTGRVVIVDTDDYYDTFHPELPFVREAYAALAKLQALRRGDRYVGRKLSTYLADTGYRDVDIKPIPIVVQGGRNKEVITEDIVPMFEEECENIVAAGLMGQREFDLALSAMHESVQRKNSLYASLIFIASGTK